MPEAVQKHADDRHGIDVRAVLRVGAALVVMLALAGAGAYAAWSAWKGTQPYDAPNTERDFRIAGPALQSAPQPERETFLRDKEQLLQSFGWVDPAAGIARIPIGNAMDILVKRHGEGGKDRGKEMQP